MTVVDNKIAIGMRPTLTSNKQRYVTRENWFSYSNRRLTGAFLKAEQVTFDDSSRFIFFSDIHRGDNSRADAFIPNRDLFLHVLGRYYEQGYSYIEVGDGDELWKNWRFQDVYRAHEQVFDLLHCFNRMDRLHLIIGNHDMQKARRDAIEKDGMIAREGLILSHSRTGQKLFIVHGHQADLTSDCLTRVNQFIIGFIWRRFQLLGLTRVQDPINHSRKFNMIERAIANWAKAKQQLIICGHTHRAASMLQGQAPYFNTGSCIVPGCITGLELINGEISLVKWFIQGCTRPGRALRLERQLMAPSQKLCNLTY